MYIEWTKMHMCMCFCDLVKPVIDIIFHKQVSANLPLMHL